MAVQEIAAGDIATELRDIEAIKQLKARYIRMVDSKNWDAWRALFTSDCQVETEGGLFVGPDAVVASVSQALASGTTVHRATMPEITLTGPDSASGIWAMQDVVDLVVRGEHYEFHGYGYYYEEYQRGPDGWKIKGTKLVRQAKKTSGGAKQ
jgi:SnoaL-like domain